MPLNASVPNPVMASLMGTETCFSEIFDIATLVCTLLNAGVSELPEVQHRAFAKGMHRPEPRLQHDHGCLCHSHLVRDGGMCERVKEP